MSPCIFIGPTAFGRPVVAVGGKPNLLARWGKWLELSSDLFDRTNGNDERVWFLSAARGVFDFEAVAGALRLSRLKTETSAPLAVLVAGDVPAPGDAWYSRAERLLNRIVDGFIPDFEIRHHLESLPDFLPAAPCEDGVVCWIDDWEVHELRYQNIREFADYSFADMFGPRFELVEA